MVGLTDEQRVVLIDKLPDVANVAVGALVFGQFIGNGPVSWWLIAIGFVLWMVLGGLALYFARRR